MNLKPCPFCGGQARWEAYDRLIKIGCSPCGYNRAFPGLLQTVPNDKPILEYKNGDGTIRKVKPALAVEFYHHDASERAEEAWNNRATAQGAVALNKEPT